MLLLLLRSATATAGLPTGGRGGRCGRGAAFLGAAAGGGVPTTSSTRPFTSPSPLVAAPSSNKPRASIGRAATAAASSSAPRSSSRQQRPPRGGSSGGGGASSRVKKDDPSTPPPPAEFPKEPHVRLRAGKARLFLEGNPLVFGEAVEGAFGGGVAEGDYVPVVDSKGNLIGKGVYNPHSMFRVRLLWHAREKGERAHAETLGEL